MANNPRVTIDDITIENQNLITKILRFNHITPSTERIVSYYLGSILGLHPNFSDPDQRTLDTTPKIIKRKDVAFIPQKISRLRDLRRVFWNNYPEFKEQYYRSYKTQNDYPTDVRCKWVDFVDLLEKNCVITDTLAQRATL